MTQRTEIETAGEAAGHPPYLYPDYKSTRLRAPKEPLVILPHTLSEISGPAYGHGRIGELDDDLTRQYEGDPLGERIIVTGRVLDGDGRPVRDSLVEVWQANAAGRYIHQDDRAPGPAGPELLRRGPLPHRRRGPLPLRHGKARRVPVEEPRQRLAAGAHPLLGLRLVLRHQAHNPDVLPRRPALRVRPDLPVGARPEGPAAPDLLLRPRDDRARVGARLPLRHRPRGAATRRRSEDHR